MRKRVFDSAFCLWLLLTSCAIPGMDNTPSGRQETKITGTDSIIVISRKLKDEMLNVGYRVREHSGDSIVFEKEIEGRRVANWYAAQTGTVSIPGMDNVPRGNKGVSP